MTRKFLSVAVCTILLATPTISHAKSKEPPKPLTVEDVVGQIKKELGEYNAFVARNPVDPPDNAVCGGNVEFEVTGVTVELATTTQRTSSGKVGAEIPIGPVTLSGGGSGSKGQKNSQSLNFTFYPAKTASQNGMWSEGQVLTGFAAVLAELRTSLSKAAAKGPCFSFGPEDKQKNSIKFGFTVTRDRGGSAGISFLIFKIGGEKKKSDEASNSVTIAFTGTGTAFTPM